jgi:hypothetical protein
MKLLLATVISAPIAWGLGNHAWWWVLPLAIAAGMIVGFPKFEPAASEHTAEKARTPRRAKCTVIDFAAERARRAGVKANG